MEDEYETIADAKKGLEEAENELNESRAKLDDLRQQLKDAEARFDNAVINHARVKELYEKASLNQPSQWNTMYQKLLQWKEEHGNCLVPNSRDANDDMKQLSKWVMNQRVFYKYFMNGDTKHIREDRVEALKKIGFVWDVFDHLWNQNFEDLRQYYEEHGTFDMPRKENNKLHSFVGNVRRAKRRKDGGVVQTQLTDSRIEKLNSINFVWDSKEPSRLKPDGDEVDFDALYTSLVKFKQTYGHVQVHKYKQNNNQPAIEFKRLTTFVSFVRKEHENYIRNKPSSLDAERVQNLTELGVAWKRPASEPRMNTGRSGERLTRKRRKNNEDNEEDEDDLSSQGDVEN